MERDLSRILYDEYFSKNNREVALTMKNGRLIKGIFVSFFHGNEECGEPFIIGWRIVNQVADALLITDVSGECNGEIINQNDILNIRFLDNDWVLVFE